MSSLAQNIGGSEQEPIVLSSPETERADSVDRAIETNEHGQQDDPPTAHATNEPSQEGTIIPVPDIQLGEYQEPTEELTIEEAAVRFDDWKTNVWDAGVNETRASLGLPPWHPGAPVSGRKRKASALAEEDDLDGLLDSFQDGDLDTEEQLEQQEAELRRKRPRLGLDQGLQSVEQAAEDGRGHIPAQQTSQSGQFAQGMRPKAPVRHEGLQQQDQQRPQDWEQQLTGGNLAPLSEAQRRYQLYHQGLQGVYNDQPRADVAFTGVQQPQVAGSPGAQEEPKVFHPQPRYPLNFTPGAPFPRWQAGQDIARQMPVIPTAVAPPPDWGRLQHTAATAAKLPDGGLETVGYAQNAPALPPPPTNNMPRPRPQHPRNHPIGGDFVEPTSRQDFKEIYRALYPTLAMLLRTKAQLANQGTRTWIRLNIRYREAWDDLKTLIDRAQSGLKPADKYWAAQQYVPKRGALGDGWADYVADWDMPYRGLGAQPARNRWLDYNWNSPEREQEKERAAPIIVSAAFAASEKAQQFRGITGWLLGPHVQVEWNDSHVVVVDIENKKPL